MLAINELTYWPRHSRSFPTMKSKCYRRNAYITFQVIEAFCLIFRRQGTRKREWRSWGWKAVWSSITRNSQGEMLTDSQAWAEPQASAPCFHSTTRGRQAWGWERLAPALAARFRWVLTSHCVFIYCSWTKFSSLFHVLKFICGKHYQYPWILFFCCWGKEELFFSASP